MAVDPLGLVYSGADGTGAAFKAPWTSYDPYQAEMMKGQTKLKMLEDKKKAEEKKKEDALKSVVASPVKWDPYLEMPNRITGKASDYLTQLYATGQSDKVQSEANKIASFSKSTANVINALADNENRLKMKAASDRDVIRNEFEENLAILRDPSLAPPDIYPEVAQLLEKNREIAKEVQKTNPWMDDQEAENYARLKTSDQLSSKFMDLPKEYRYDQWMPKMMAESKAMMDKNQEAKLSGSTRTLTKDVTREQAEDIIERNFTGNHLFASQMRREFRKLDDKAKEQYGDALTYAKQTYYEPLTGDVELKSRSGGFNLSFGGGAGTSMNVDPATNQVFKDAVGGLDITNPTTYVTPGPKQTTNQQVSATGVVVGGGAHEYVLASEDEKGGTFESLPGTYTMGTLRKRESTAPLNITFGSTKDYPVNVKPLKIKINGQDQTIPAGSMLTDYTFDLIRKSGQKVPAGVIKMKPYINATILIDDESKFGYLPYDRYKGELQNQLQQNKKQFNAHPSFGPDQEYIQKTYGIEFTAPAAPSPTTTTTTTTTTAAPKKNEINRADIPAKAKAAGYSVEDYTKMLKEKGIIIK
jgi:hypothetical protein